MYIGNDDFSLQKKTFSSLMGVPTDLLDVKMMITKIMKLF